MAAVAPISVGILGPELCRTGIDPRPVPAVNNVQMGKRLQIVSSLDCCIKEEYNLEDEWCRCPKDDNDTPEGFDIL
jgi:hypothetical protein